MRRRRVTAWATLTPCRWTSGMDKLPSHVDATSQATAWAALVRWHSAAHTGGCRQRSSHHSWRCRARRPNSRCLGGVLCYMCVCFPRWPAACLARDALAASAGSSQQPLKRAVLQAFVDGQPALPAECCRALRPFILSVRARSHARLHDRTMCASVPHWLLLCWHVERK